MAGGDGSQAIVAAIAAERDLPYACIPAGTRNHFALDLGVDRDDVVGALDAFVDGGERRVDLAEVNGRVFVNNVSLGLYAEAVQREGYRDAKLRTILDTLPDALGPEGERARPALDRARAATSTPPARRSSSPTTATGSVAPSARARGRGSTTACSGSRSPARRPGGGESGRPLQRPWREWSAPEFEVDADGPIAAGIDGEATRARAAAALPHPARRAARADRARPSGRLAVRGDARRAPSTGSRLLRRRRPRSPARPTPPAAASAH